MDIWNYNICVSHPPTLDLCPHFLGKRNYILKQVPTHLLVRLFMKAFLSTLYFSDINLNYRCLSTLQTSNRNTNTGGFLKFKVEFKYKTSLYTVGEFDIHNFLHKNWRRVGDGNFDYMPTCFLL